MSAQSQYLQSSYLPTVQHRPRGSSQAIVLPDWLSAAYVDLADKITSYTFYTIRDEDVGQPDGIAYHQYGESNWWWVICDYNGIIDPFTDMVPGMRIKIPDLLQVTMFLQKQLGSDRIDNRGQFITI